MARVTLGLLLGVMLVGCNAAPSGPELYPVKGYVKKGGAGLKEVSIALIPVDAATGVTVMGATNDQGEFEIVTPQGKKGAPAGSYKVVLSVDAKMDYSNAGRRPTGKTEDKIPQGWRSPETTPMVFEVKSTVDNLVQIDF